MNSFYIISFFFLFFFFFIVFFLFFFFFFFFFFFSFCFLFLFPLLFLFFTLLPGIHFLMLMLLPSSSCCRLLALLIVFYWLYISSSTYDSSYLFSFYLVPHQLCPLLTYLLFIVLCPFLFLLLLFFLPLPLCPFDYVLLQHPPTPSKKRHQNPILFLLKKTGPGLAQFAKNILWENVAFCYRVQTKRLEIQFFKV